MEQTLCRLALYVDVQGMTEGEALRAVRKALRLARVKAEVTTVAKILRVPDPTPHAGH